MKHSFKYLVGRLLGGTGAPASPAVVRKGATSPNKTVWRISASAPNGEWVERGASPDAAAHKKASADLANDWTSSSMDLLSGADVVEHTMNKVSGVPTHGAAGGKPRSRKK